MKPTIEPRKNEVAIAIINNTLQSKLDKGLDSGEDLAEALIVCMELYHFRKCEEAGRELSKPINVSELKIHTEASTLLASLQSKLLQLGMDGQVMQGEHEQVVSLNAKLEAKVKDYEEVREKYLKFLDRNVELEALVEAKDKEKRILQGQYKEMYIDNEALKIQLQEAKAEAEKWKGIVELKNL